MDTKKKEGLLLRSDGKVLRELLPSEMAGIVLEETFNPGCAGNLEDMLLPPEEAEQHLAWMRDQKEKEERFAAWWKSATYEQRLAAVNKWYNILLPHIRAKRAPAEDVARITDISSDWFLSSVLARHWEP
jgi:hypothetical protein